MQTHTSHTSIDPEDNNYNGPASLHNLENRSIMSSGKIVSIRCHGPKDLRLVSRSTLAPPTNAKDLIRARVYRKSGTPSHRVKEKLPWPSK